MSVYSERIIETAQPFVEEARSIRSQPDFHDLSWDELMEQLGPLCEKATEAARALTEEFPDKKSWEIESDVATVLSELAAIESQEA